MILETPDIHFSKPPSPPTPLPFRVRTIGRVRRSRYHTTRGTFHDDAMLTVFLAGRGRYLAGGRSIPVTPGMVGLVLPGAGVGVLMADPADPYDHYYCRFAGDLALAMARAAVALAGGASFFVHPGWEVVAGLLRRAIEAGGVLRRPAGERFGRVDAILAEALAVLSETSEPAVPPPTAVRLADYFQEHLADPTDLGAMAAHFGYSRSHLCRLVRRELGSSPQRAWEAAKMDHARALLAQPQLSVEQVARRVGYRDPSYFSNVFLRVTGQRPTDYRRGMR